MTIRRLVKDYICSVIINRFTVIIFLLMSTFEKATVIALEPSIDYAPGSVISKQVTINRAGNVTLFSFDKGQGLTEHTANFDASMARPRSVLTERRTA